MRPGSNPVETYKESLGGNPLLIRESLPRIIGESWEQLSAADGGQPLIRQTQRVPDGHAGQTANQRALVRHASPGCLTPPPPHL